MRTTTLGRHGPRTSRICLGCMGLGDPSHGQHTWTVGEKGSEDVIRSALDSGINFFDTAIGYQDGMTDEELLSGVTATDETDGDVTGSLVVEKVSEVGDGTVIVTFGARDRSNNLVKASRIMGE